MKTQKRKNAKTQNGYNDWYKDINQLKPIDWLKIEVENLTQSIKNFTKNTAREARQTKETKMKCFAIRDLKAEGFSTPFFSLTFGLAERDFKTVSQDPKSAISKNPEDFSLYYIGDFDQQTGLMEPVNPPKHICDAPQPYVQVSP